MPAPSSFSAALTEANPTALKRLSRAVVRHNGNITHAARLLGLSYQALRKKAKRYPWVQAALDEAKAAKSAQPR